MHRFEHKPYRVEPGKPVKLDRFATEAGDEHKKSVVKAAMKQDIEDLAEAQRVLWASGQYAMLIILQAMDAAGKDGTIRHVMSGVNPQGCEVHGFKAPNSEELQHHFLWRPTRYLPPRGMIGIFNRSYYEEVLIVRVHPSFLEKQALPPEEPLDGIWQRRFEDINHFEKTLVRNGTRVLKFYLHLSKKEQRLRFLDRLEQPEKNWKFNAADLKERCYWDDYRAAYEDMLEHTSTECAPWHVIPADNKWFARALVADIIADQINRLDLSYPTVPEEDRDKLKVAWDALKRETDDD